MTRILPVVNLLIGVLMSEENKALVRRWFEEVWNQGRADAIDEMFGEYGIAHGLSDDPSNPLRGPGDFKPFHNIVPPGVSKHDRRRRGHGC